MAALVLWLSLTWLSTLTRSWVVPQHTTHRTLHMTDPYKVVEELLADAVEEDFNWDKHLARLASDDIADRARRRAEEAELLGEWEPTTEEDLDLMASVGGEDAFALESEPSIFRQRWDDVDPEEHNYRNVPNNGGCSWSRIRLRSDWWQFDQRSKLKEDQGWVRFDMRAFNVPDAAFDATPAFSFGHIEPIVAAKLLPVLEILDSTVVLLEARPDGYVRLKYRGLAKHRHGIEAYARGLLAQSYPELTQLEIESHQVADPWDGAAAFTRSDLGRPTNLC